MDLEKVRKIIEREAPQYEIVDTGAAESESDAATDDPADVDANSAPLSSWDKFQTPTPDEADAKPEDRKSTRLNSSHIQKSRMPSSA